MNTKQKVYKYDLDDLLTFGKYKNEIIEDIIDLDPKYIEWALKDVSWFGLTDEALEELQSSIEYDERKEEEEWLEETGFNYWQGFS